MCLCKLDRNIAKFLSSEQSVCKGSFCLILQPQVATSRGYSCTTNHSVHQAQVLQLGLRKFRILTSLEALQSVRPGHQITAQRMLVFNSMLPKYISDLFTGEQHPHANLGLLVYFLLFMFLPNPLWQHQCPSEVSANKLVSLAWVWIQYTFRHSYCPGVQPVSVAFLAT